MTDLKTELARLSAEATQGEWETGTCEIIVAGSGAYAGYPPKPGCIASLHDGEYIENPRYREDAAFVTTLVNAYRSNQLQVVPEGHVVVPREAVQERRGFADWLNIAEFDPEPKGPFVATYCDGSGARILLATDDGVLDGEDLDPVHDLDAATYSLYAWLPEDFETWGMIAATKGGTDAQP